MSNLLNALKIDFPDSVSKLRMEVPALSVFPDKIIEIIWKEYSESKAAGFLFVTEDEIREFEDWVSR
jgi:hypothetical protein